MRATFRLETGVLDLIAPEIEVDERRGLGPTDAGRFADWRATYRALLDRREAEGDLLRLGGDMAAWLDGGEGWLGRVLRSCQPPLIVEFQGLDPGDETVQAFLQAPWELLAGPDGHLAADAIVRYAPVRRLGRTSAVVWA